LNALFGFCASIAVADISQEWQQSVSLKAESVLQVSVTAIQPVLASELP